MINLTREEQKAQRERRVFTEFAEAAGLAVQQGSIISERPPAPDLSCVMAGANHHFELSEITDPKTASNLAVSIKTMRIVAWMFKQDEPLIRAIQGKAEKNYKNLNGPLSLLLYYDRQSPPPEGGLSDSTQRQLSLIARSMLLQGWSGVWIYDTEGGEVLWHVD
jgi:hypothetical protein